MVFSGSKTIISITKMGFLIKVTSNMVEASGACTGGLFRLRTPTSFVGTGFPPP